MIWLFDIHEWFKDAIKFGNEQVIELCQNKGHTF